jgi:hypothetical protein
VGDPVTSELVAGSPGQLLRLSIGHGVKGWAFCDASSIGQCAAWWQRRSMLLDPKSGCREARRETVGLIGDTRRCSARPKADDIFDLRGVIRETGCVVVVHPDQYVALVLPLHGYDGLADFFAGVPIDAE